MPLLDVPLTRLDGQAPRATVAESVMKEKERRMTGQQPQRPERRLTRAALQAPLRAAGTPGWRCSKRVARNRHFALADQASPVRRYSGAPSLRGGVGYKPPPGGKRRAQSFPDTKGESKRRQCPLRSHQPALRHRQDVVDRLGLSTHPLSLPMPQKTDCFVRA